MVGRAVLLAGLSILAQADGPPPAVPNRSTMPPELPSAEWAGARKERLEGGGAVWLRREGNLLHVAVMGPATGFPTLFVGSRNRVEVLHASAALGEVAYVRQGDAWIRHGAFDWQVRDREVPEATLAAERSAFFAARGWLANASRRGAPVRTFRIRLTPARRFLAVVFLSTETMTSAWWPATLQDDCRNLPLLRGETPDTLRFAPSQWSEP